jgi:hypothetical protein
MRLALLILLMLVFLLEPGCERPLRPGDPGWDPGEYTKAAMVVAMPSNYTQAPYHGHCVSRERLRVLMNQVVEDVLESGGYVETFEARYSWQGTMFKGPAMVAVVRKPDGNVSVYVDHSALNPAIVKLEEVETCL